MIYEALNNIEKSSNYNTIVLNEEFLNINEKFLEKKLDFWKNNTKIKLNNEGRCEINVNDKDLKDFLQEEINREMITTNNFIPDYLNKAFIYFTDNIEDFIVSFVHNNQIYNYSNIYMFYKNINEILLYNPLIKIIYETSLKESNYSSLTKLKTKVITKEVKLSKILDKMNTIMLEHENNYKKLMVEKKFRIREKIKIEKDLKTYKEGNPYWVQQKFLPYKNRNLIFSINPLDIFTCSGQDEVDEDEINLTKFHTCYSMRTCYNSNNEIEIFEEGQFSNPFNLYKLNCMLTKGIVFIPNGNEVKYKNIKLMGMAARSHIYLQSKENIYCETSYPQQEICFSKILNSIFKSISFFDQLDLDYNNYSNNDYYVVSEFEEEIIPYLKNKRQYLDNIGLFFTKKRYCIFNYNGNKYNTLNGPEVRCSCCGNQTTLPFRENFESLTCEELQNIYCDCCKEDFTCENCGKIDENIENIENKNICQECLEKYYIKCVECEDYKLKNKYHIDNLSIFCCNDCK